MNVLSRTINDSSEKHVLVASLVPVTLGEESRRIPPHVTILPPFYMDTIGRTLFDYRMADIIEENPSLLIHALGEEAFGENEDTVAQRLSGVLFQVHAAALAIANTLNLVFDRTYTGIDYSPHVTGYEGVLNTGDLIKLDTVQLYVTRNGLKKAVSIYRHSGVEACE